jgi:arylsulfatase A-like enzyme
MGCGCRGDAPSSRPASDEEINVVFISFDALQAAHVGCLGYHRDVTPTIDALARHGYNFTNHYSVASWTVPASMTWFTGVYPSEHRLTNKFAVYKPPVRKLANLKELSPELVTLAEILRLNGYATGGFTGNAGVSGEFGFAQGFDVYYEEPGHFGGMDRSMSEALKWVHANRDRKFFLFLHGYDIHGQSTPAGGFDYRFVDKEYDQKYTGSEQEQEALREEGLDKGRISLRDVDVRFWRAVYDEKIQRTDAKFRQFLDDFNDLGVTDRTLFVLTSDHGTELYEHRRFDHGFTLYDELIRVPLIVRLPRQTTGRAIAARVSSIDILPTILDLVKASVPENVRNRLRGRSLAPAMNGEPERRDIYSETDYREYTHKRSIITPDGWKLIYTLENRSRELYNLNADPGEADNLVATEPKLARQLEERLFDHFASIGHDLGTKRWEIGLNPVYASQAKDPPKK